MNPIYRFQLSAGTDTRQAFPVYKDDLAIEYALEQGEEFYRGKLSGKLTFQRDDYAFIRNQAFDTQFDVVISISYNAGQTWAVYWSGQFWKTDCQFNEDDETVIVTPSVNDRYNATLAGLDQEYNLIDLAPVIQPVKLDKRPMIQVYVPGQTVIGCFLSGMWWEQECEPVSDYIDLTEKYHFSLVKNIAYLSISGDTTPALPAIVQADQGKYFDIVSEGFRFRRVSADASHDNVQIIDLATETLLWSAVINTNDIVANCQPQNGATGVAVINMYYTTVYARYVTDEETAFGLTAFPIPDDDLVENNRNYHYVIGYYFPDTIVLSDELSTTPTKWGIYQPGQYYVMFTSPDTDVYESFPIARATWGRVSLWFVFDRFDWLVESGWRKEYTLKDAYPLWSVIAVLLAKVAPGITHAGTVDYSQFLYGVNPVTLIDQQLFITPKSNIIASGYDQPAQKAMITLQRVLDMLRDCFRCFWFIDEQNRFRIEHISWFMGGGSYSGSPEPGIDLTQQIVTRNGKPWSYVRNQYQFDKPEMPARYQFGWMDDVTELFEGFPIDIISKYVNPDNIEQIDVSQFTSDVDYILLNPGEISKDGFVLFGAELADGTYKLPYVEFYINDSRYILQNAWVSFMFLQQYYMYDMPAWNVEINGERQAVYGIKKLKTQTLRFPVLVEPDLFKLIKTNLGNGTIQKMSVNLSSRNANTTLKYDTEQ